MRRLLPMLALFGLLLQAGVGALPADIVLCISGPFGACTQDVVEDQSQCQHRHCCASKPTNAPSEEEGPWSSVLSLLGFECDPSCYGCVDITLPDHDKWIGSKFELSAAPDTHVNVGSTWIAAQPYDSHQQIAKLFGTGPPPISRNVPTVLLSTIRLLV